MGMMLRRLRRCLVKRMIDLDLVPCRIRWKKAVRGLGRIYSETLLMLETPGKKRVNDLNKMMYRIGFEQAGELAGVLDLEKSLEDCAYALMLMHRIFGIKSRIVKKEKNRIVIHVTRCHWGKGMKGWTPATCASISSYEEGLVKGFLPRALHSYTKRRSLGHAVCELVLTAGETAEHD